MDALTTALMATAWLSALGCYCLDRRCPVALQARWAAVVVLTSWAGLAAFVATYYWWPELRSTLGDRSNGLPSWEHRRGRPR